MKTTLEKYLAERAEVTNQQITQLQHRIVRRNFPAGATILAKGQVCRHTLFVEEGLLKYFSIDHLGKEHVIQFAPENWFVSDRSSLYFNEPTKFFITAIEDSRVALVDQAFLDLASEISPQFRSYNEQILQNHIRHLQNRINMLLGAPAKERYLDFIEQYPDLLMRVPQWMIASYLGITPESLSRVRRELSSTPAISSYTRTRK